MSWICFDRGSACLVLLVFSGLTLTEDARAQAGVWRDLRRDSLWTPWVDGFLPSPVDPGSYLPGEVIGCKILPDPDGFLYWWLANQDSALTGSLGEAAGEAREALRPAWGTAVEASLLECLGDDAPMVRASAAIALARVSESDDAFQALQGLLLDPVPDVGDSAALALGILGDSRGIPRLEEILEGEAGGDGLPPNSRRRVFAACGLALIGHCSQVEVDRLRIGASLLGPVRRRGGEPADLRATCVIALGAVPSNGLREALPSLLRLAVDPGEDPMVRAQAPNSLVKWAVAASDPAWAERVGEVLLASVGGESSSSGLDRASAFQALGQLAPFLPDQERLAIARACSRHIRSARFPRSRQMALLTLGEAAGSMAGADPHRQEAVAELLDWTTRGPHSLRPWAAFAVGRMAEVSRRLGRPALPEEATERVLKQALKERDPRSRLANILALGLMRASEAAPEVTLLMKESRDGPLVGSCAIALALMANPPRGNDILQGMRERRWRLANGILPMLPLGRFGLASVIPNLLRSMESGECRRDREAWAATALALGSLPSEESAAALMTMVTRSHDRSAWRRAYAIGALGLMFDRSGRPWHLPLSAGVNFRALPEALLDPWRGTGVFQLL